MKRGKNLLKWPIRIPVTAVCWFAVGVLFAVVYFGEKADQLLKWGLSDD